MVIAVAGAVALGVLHGANQPVAQAPSSPAVVETVVLPNEPPQNSDCSGVVIGHSDVKHPQLGMVRVFLFLDRSQSVYSTGRAPGCALPVTHTGRVLPAIGVDGFAKFGFASPAVDATGNMFIEYENASNATGSGLVVLIPNAGGFRERHQLSEIHDPDGYLTGENDYYSAELIGSVDGVYTIRQSRNDCEPNCAEGTLIIRNLHWDGRRYVPEAVPPATTRDGDGSGATAATSHTTVPGANWVH